MLVDKGASLKLPSELSLAEESINDIKRKTTLSSALPLPPSVARTSSWSILAHDTKNAAHFHHGVFTLLEEAPDMPLSSVSDMRHVALSKAYRLDAMLDEFFEITRYNLGAISIERERLTWRCSAIRLRKISTPKRKRGELIEGERHRRRYSIRRCHENGARA